MTDRLERFLDAQDRGGTYEAALAELRSGRKRSHWMWFVFPQVAGLGRSDTARFYALRALTRPASTWRIRFSGRVSSSAPRRCCPCPTQIPSQ